MTIVANFQVEYAAALAAAMADKNEVAFLVWERYASILDRSPLSQVDVQFLASPRSGGPRNLSDGGHILRYLRRHEPDILHLQNPYTWHAPWMPFLQEYPLVVTVHDPLPHLGIVQPHWRPLFGWTLRWTDAAIVHGDAMRELLNLTYDYPLERTHVVPHGVFTHFGSPPAGPMESIDVLFFGRIFPYKGLDVLLRADPIIRQNHPDFQLAIVGEGDLAPYRKLLPTTSHVRVVNRFVSREEAAHFLHSARLLVLPYVDASQSGVAAAALAVGTPIVATDVGSLPEVVKDGETGLVVPSGDAEALAEAISRLLSDEALRKRIVKGIQQASANLSWGRVAELTSSVYEAVLCESPS